MVKVKRASSIPLFLSDPYFSIWSPADKLTDCDTQSWTGKKQAVRGYIRVGTTTYRFMGADSVVPAIPQVDLQVTATQTTYIFENNQIKFSVSFSQDLDLNDLYKISEPVTVITTKVVAKKEESIKVYFTFSEEIARDTNDKEPMHWGEINSEEESIAWMGKGRQTPLDSSGDLIDINWGYLYLAANRHINIIYSKTDSTINASYLLKTGQTISLLVAYDDIHSINYFGTPTNALWKEKYNGMYELLQNYLQTLDNHLASCNQIDKQINQKSIESGGENLAYITALSYRQSVCAHKLIRDSSGEIIFLSKECSSNGCIGTVDISYPSIPLYLLFQTELAKGMLRPIYKFAEMPVWEFPFAPHDVGCYPYATGQVYGEKSQPGSKNWSDRSLRDTIFDYYQLPAGQGIYNEYQQMPIEESGNMLIMVSAIFLCDRDEKFFNQYMSTNFAWAEYLIAYGQDPDNQLCTDDFAGHLSHNCNLSIKAITALGMFGRALIVAGKIEKGKFYSDNAKRMAKIWIENATTGNSFTPLAFDKPNSWSLKYNVVWDKLFNLNLFPEEFMQMEMEKYISELNEFGPPLDNRADYTKADWISWITIYAPNNLMKDKLLGAVKNYICSTENRVPFSDWYDTKNGNVMNFRNRSVVGAMFMPLLHQKLEKENVKDDTLAKLY
jgi:hypothetical protein